MSNLTHQQQDTRDTAGAPLGAVTAPPVVSGSPEEIADGVFVVPDRRVPFVPNIGVIVGQRAALVIDTGLGPRSGSVVHQIAKELAGDRPLFLTLTHFHPEHGFGAQAFGDAAIIYNRLQHEEFREKAAGFLEMFGRMGDLAARELDGVELVEPHVVYDEAADIDLGGKLVQLRNRGPAHTRGDQSIFLPKERILFTGDLVENRASAISPLSPPNDIDVDGSRWISVIQELHRLDARIVVPGHGPRGNNSLLALTNEYLRWLRSQTKRLAGEGNDADAIIAELERQIRAHYSDWDAFETGRVGYEIRSFLAGA